MRSLLLFTLALLVSGCATYVAPVGVVSVQPAPVVVYPTPVYRPPVVYSAPVYVQPVYRPYYGYGYGYGYGYRRGYAY